MKCNCCKKQTVEFPYKDEFTGNSLRICPECEHIQLGEILTRQFVSDYYSKQYSENRQCHIGEEYFKIMQKRAKAQVDFIKSVIGYISGKKIYDIGCGYGFLIEEFLNYSDNVSGCELDPQASEFCRNKGLKVEKFTDEEDYTNLEKTFLLTLSHTFEHLRDAEKASQVLKEKADFIFIEIPLYSKSVCDVFLDKEGHVNFFNLNSFKLFLENNGFEVLKPDATDHRTTYFLIKRTKQLKKTCINKQGIISLMNIPCKTRKVFG